VGEGLSTAEVAHELAEHRKHSRHAADEPQHHDRLISIAEGVLLSVVTIVAAWSGFAAAKWNTESRTKFAQASALRTEANRAYGQSLTLRGIDASMFNAWFAAYLSGDRNSMRVAEGRFRPPYRVAFDAWLATHPFTNPNAPPGPQQMPQYVPSGEAQSKLLDTRADAAYAGGERDGRNSDDYIRTTVILASVLFIVGLSTQFRFRVVRLGLLLVGGALLIVAAVALLQLPSPP
jgi:hypothetical protein